MVQQVFICFPLASIGGKVERSCDVRCYQLPQPASRHPVSSVIATYCINSCIAGLTSTQIAGYPCVLKEGILLHFTCILQGSSVALIIFCVYSRVRGATPRKVCIYFTWIQQVLFSWKYREHKQTNLLIYPNDIFYASRRAPHISQI